MGNTASVHLIQALARDTGGPHVSLFLPADAGPARFEALLRTARAHLASYSWPSEFLREPADTDVPAPKAAATAFFAAQGWHTSFTVPFDLREQAVVAESFHVKPVLPLLEETGRFHVLALSSAGVRLYEGNTERLREVTTEELAATPQQVLAYDRLQKQREFHVAGHAGSHGRVTAHGQGIGDEVRKEHVHQYFVHVARALPAAVPAGEPLVLAGVGYLQSMFRRSWPRAIPEGVPGSVEHMPTEQLHSRSLACVRRDHMRRLSAAREGYEALRGTDLAVTRLGAALQASIQGRVDTLWVSLDDECWGTSGDPNACSAEQLPGTEDLLNLAACRTLLSAGRVYALPGDQVPAGGQVAAILRY